MQEEKPTGETEPSAGDVEGKMSCPMCRGAGHVPHGWPGMMKHMPPPGMMRHMGPPGMMRHMAPPPIALMFMMVVLTLLGFIGGFLVGNAIED